MSNCSGIFLQINQNVKYLNLNWQLKQLPSVRYQLAGVTFELCIDNNGLNTFEVDNYLHVLHVLYDLIGLDRLHLAQGSCSK